jgi:pimeloyl-ACP methyl ester carboxylesterase
MTAQSQKDERQTGAAPGEVAILPGRLDVRTSDNAERPDYFLLRPENLDPTRPPLVCVHGISRNAEEHVQAFAALAAAQRRLLVVPLFDEVRFDGFQRLVQGTERAVEALWRDVEATTGVDFGAVDMFGFSAGAQFVHRYAMLNPARVRSQLLVAAGWYTFPTTQEPFPYGIKRDRKRGRRCAGNLRDFLAIPTLVLVGSEDSQRDESLRSSPEVDIAQGLHRIERAVRWTCAVLKAATRLGVTPTVQFSMLPGCGHAFADCVEYGGLVEAVDHWLRRE